MKVSKKLLLLLSIALTACGSERQAMDADGTNLMVPSKTSAYTARRNATKVDEAKIAGKKASNPTKLDEARAVGKKTAPAKMDDQLEVQDKTQIKSKKEELSASNDQGDTKETKNSRKSSGKAAKVTSWELSGAMAARNKSKAWSASVNWMQRGQSNYQIRLFGPLGSGTVMINRSGGVVSFKDGPRSDSSSNADQLLLKQTGVRLPVNSLYYWVRGVPAPGAVQAEKRDQANHLLMLRQSGYTITYGNYTSASGVDLPKQIRLQGNGVFIKMVVNRWRV